MPAMPATAEAIAFAQGAPGARRRASISRSSARATSDPLSDPEEIPGLVDDDGRFLATRTVRLRALARRLPVEQIEREIVAQIAAVRDEGVEISPRRLASARPQAAVVPGSSRP